MSDTAYVSAIPDCDFHPGTPATVDGRTSTGQWANMCGRCHDAHGVGLGTGKGQRLIVGERPAPTDAAIRAAIESGDFDLFEELVGDGDPADWL